jgi:hypothetical protein
MVASLCLSCSICSTMLATLHHTQRRQALSEASEPYSQCALVKSTQRLCNQTQQAVPAYCSYHNRQSALESECSPCTYPLLKCVSSGEGMLKPPCALTSLLREPLISLPHRHSKVLLISICSQEGVSLHHESRTFSAEITVVPLCCVLLCQIITAVASWVLTLTSFSKKINIALIT